MKVRTGLKRYGRICCLLLGLLSLAACEKERHNGTVLITVQHDGEPVPGATVRISADTLAVPGMTYYEDSGRCDSQGDIYFEDLHPGTYRLVANGYFADDQEYVSGTSALTVVYKSRQNHYRVFIAAAP